MQQEILQVYQQFPWASEATADRIAASVNDGGQTRMRMNGLFAMSFSKTAYANLIRSFKRNKLQKNKEIRSEKEFMNNLSRASKRLTSNGIDGLGSIADLTTSLKQATEELDLSNRAGNWLRDLTKNRGKALRGAGLIAGGAIKFGGSAAGVAIGVSGFAAQFINAQDKLIKTMIDIGLADGNMEGMTQLRRDSASLGLGMDEFTKVLKASSNIVAGSGDTALDGAQKLSNLIITMSRDPSVNKFGMRTSDLASQVSILAEALYNSNQISNLDPRAQLKIVEVFETTQAIALGLAATTGLNRKEMLSAMEEIRTDRDLQATFRIEQDKYVQKHGQDAFDNFKNGTETFLAYLKSTMGESSPFYQAAKSSIDAAAYDINYDRTILNNLTDEMHGMLMEMGPETFRTFTDSVDKILQGGTDAQGAVVDASRVLGAIADANKNRRRPFSFDAITQTTNMVMSQSSTILDQARNITLEDLRKSIDESISGVEFADDAIKTVDQIAIAMTQTLEAMLPGFDTLDSILDATFQAGNVAMGVIRFVGEVAGFNDYGLTQSNLEDLMENAPPRDVVVFKPGTPEYNAQPASMRITPNGPITALSMAAFMSTTQNMLSQQQINNSSSEIISGRLEQLQETLVDFQNKSNNEDNRYAEEQIAQYKVSERLIEEQIQRLTARLANLQSREQAEGAR